LTSAAVVVGGALHATTVLRMNHRVLNDLNWLSNRLWCSYTGGNVTVPMGVSGHMIGDRGDGKSHGKEDHHL